VKFGIALGRLNPAFFVEATLEAERLGYESVWLPEHLVFTVEMSRSPHPGEEHPPVPPTTPIFDVFAYLGFLAGKTDRVRLGTHVYNLGLRHPFISARAVQTLDIVSGGRAEFGIGASWLEQEWIAAELDFATRGRRVDEALAICKRLWTEPEVAHDGEFFHFDAVAFEPKPVQRPWPPILVGGESDAALRRAARAGDGWIGMAHTFESAPAAIDRLRALLAENGRDLDGFQICLGGPVESADDVAQWEALGVTRLIVSPWARSKEAVAGMRRFAELVGLGA
jgi:probable F420-dependent oxidoreductase